MSEFRAVIQGRVQGVAFRNFVLKHARHLAIRGYVRNLVNGNVEVVAQGYDDALKKLIEYLHKGPFLSHVSNVTVDWIESRREFAGFEIEF